MVKTLAKSFLWILRNSNGDREVVTCYYIDSTNKGLFCPYYLTNRREY